MELFEQWLYMEASRYELVLKKFSFIKIYLVTDGKLARCFLPPIGSQREGAFTFTTAIKYGLIITIRLMIDTCWNLSTFET